MNKSQKIFTVVFIILAGFFTATAISYVMGAYLNAGFPYNTFLFDPRGKFRDFFDFYNYSVNLNPYMAGDLSPDRNYFPFVFFIGFFFTLFNSWFPLVLMLLISIASILLVNTFFLRTGGMQDTVSIFIMTFLPYPLLFAVDRGNIELLLFVFLSFFLLFYTKEKFYISALFLSMAVAMKGYPALLILLFISGKKYREALFCTGMVIILTVIPLFIFHGGFLDNTERIIANMGKYLEVYAIYNGGLDFGCSLFGMIKALIFQFNGTADMNSFLYYYKISVAALGLLFCLFFYPGKFSGLEKNGRPCYPDGTLHTCIRRL